MYRRSAEVATESGKMLDLLVSADPLPILLKFFSGNGRP
jgi:hypothetical protein